MSAPTIYRWDDPGAPVLDGTRGKLLALLDAVLVNGYGSKPSLGWSIAFTATNKRVYRSLGNAFFYRLDAAVSVSVNFIDLSGFELMSDVDTGTGRFPATGTLEKICASSTGDTTVRPWCVIGDSMGFYLIIWWNTTVSPVGNKNNAIIYYCGDYQSIIPGDAYNSAVIGGYISENFYAYNYFFHLLDTYSVEFWSPRKSTGVAGAVNFAFMPGSGYGCQYHMGSSVDTVLPYPFNGQLLFSRPMINEGTRNTPRGFMPGLYYPQHAQPLNNFDHQTSLDGLDCIAICVTDVQYYGQVFIDTSVNFRP